MTKTTSKHLDVLNIAHTPVKASVLQTYLQCYPNQTDAKLLYEGFSTGFKLQYDGPREFTECDNLKSLRMHEHEAIEVVLKEVDLGRIAGPYKERPLENLRVSPVGLIPKKDGSWRLIHHLSYPKGNSVNSFIDDKYCTVQYTSFDTALSMLSKLGKGAMAARLDIKSAFRLLPIHPSEFELLGYKIQEFYFVDKCLPFGCSISCSLFEKLSTFMEWELKHRTGTENVVHYLDDFLVAGKADTDECSQLMDSYRYMCKEFGVPLAEEKTIGPSTLLTFLGLDIDTVNMLVRVPTEKLQKLQNALIALFKKKKTTLKELQEVTGLMSFCSKAIPSARAFIRRFYDSMTNIKETYHRIRVSNEMKEDIKVWLTFLHCFNGSSYFGDQNWINNVELALYTDSAGGVTLGCAALFKTSWVALQWPNEWHGKVILKDITFLELVPISLAFHVWGSELQNKRIVLYTDNMALVHVLNKKTSKSKRVMSLLRPMVLRAMIYDIQFKSVHIEGKHNTLVDLLSRQKWVQFHRLFPEADGCGLPIPRSFLQMLLTIEQNTF